jgi:branched-chain amino acid aminotransferase
MGIHGQGTGYWALDSARRPEEYPAAVGGRLCAVGEATVSVSDEGLLRGDGAFEFVRVYSGHPFALAEHLGRLERTCATVRLDCDREQIERDIDAVVGALGPQDYHLRVVLTRGGSRVVLAEPVSPLPDNLRLALVVDTPRRVLGGAKTLSYAGNMLAKRLAVERGFDEALFVTPEGLILELSTASFFYVDVDGALCTPPLTGDILDSITRRILLRRLAVEERPCLREGVLAWQEAFAASTAREVQAVGSIETRTFDNVPGPLTRAARAALSDEIRATTGVERDERGPQRHSL